MVLLAWRHSTRLQALPLTHRRTSTLQTQVRSGGGLRVVAQRLAASNPSYLAVLLAPTSHHPAASTDLPHHPPPPDNNLIRGVDPGTGTTTTLAGRGTVGASDGLALLSTFNGPSALAMDVTVPTESAVVYVAGECGNTGLGSLSSVPLASLSPSPCPSSPHLQTRRTSASVSLM